MKTLLAFFMHMDRKAVHAACVLIVMFAVVTGLMVFARANFEFTQDGLSEVFDYVKNSPIALPFTMGVFTAAAFFGIPQWVLIAATVIAFGPIQGGVYAWLSTMVSACVDFWVARRIGAAKIEALSAGLLGRITKLVRKNGVLTSFAVRLVPTGPFILVNMAAGVSGLRFGAFILGTGLGIIPKILVVALLAQGALTSAQGERFAVITAIGLVIVLASMFAARRVLKPVLRDR